MQGRLLHILVFIALIFLVLTSCSWQLNSNKKPNVIIVLSDDQGWGDVGYNGNKLIQTPELDSLARVGVVFNRFYVSPDCVPSFTSILTGKYNIETDSATVNNSSEVLRKSDNTIADVLKANGYSTAFFGKWHNGQNYSYSPMEKGFDTFFCFNGVGIDNYFDTELDYNGQKVITHSFLTDVITDSVISYITNTEKPFFAFVAYNTPQIPNQVPNKYFNKYVSKGLDDKTAAIYGMYENIDENVMRLEKVLKKEQKHANTIFIFLSDNGPDFVRYNGGYKGRKLQVDEGSVRVPFIIDYPNGNFISRRIDYNFAAHIDLFPTLLDLCSIQTDTLAFDGESFASILIDSTRHVTDRNFYTHKPINGDNSAWAVRTNKYVLTCYANDTALYNLNEDPSQMVNISRYEPHVYRLLICDYNKWMQQATSNSEKILATKSDIK